MDWAEGQGAEAGYVSTARSQMDAPDGNDGTAKKKRKKISKGNQKALHPRRHAERLGQQEQENVDTRDLVAQGQQEQEEVARDIVSCGYGK